MLSGSLVIGTNSGGTKEIIDDGKTGYLYTPGNADELSAILLVVVENLEQAQTIAKAGQKKAVQTFSDTANANAVLSLYERL